MLKDKFRYEKDTSVLDQVESLQLERPSHTSFLTPQDKVHIGKTNVLATSCGGYVGPNTAVLTLVDRLLTQGSSSSSQCT